MLALVTTNVVISYCACFRSIIILAILAMVKYDIKTFESTAKLNVFKVDKGINKID